MAALTRRFERNFSCRRDWFLPGSDIWIFAVTHGIDKVLEVHYTFQGLEDGDYWSTISTSIGNVQKDRKFF